MGFLDKIFNKKSKEQVESPVEMPQEQANMPRITMLSDGRLNVEFYNGSTTEKEFYDTTKLTIDVENPLSIGGKVLYNCIVAWDSYNDCIRFGEKSEEYRKIAGNRDAYKGVWLDLNLGSLQTSPEYCDVLMNKLLKKSRVNNYIEMGLQENPERPCGKYIGGVQMGPYGYEKCFSPTVGRDAHQTPFMVNRRAERRQKEAERIAAQIEAKKNERARLDQEINDLEDRFY